MNLILVDETDTPIGSKSRDAWMPGDIHRASALWLTNSKGEILMAQRAHTKKWDPGCWGAAVAGTVEEHETYESNMLKEIGEELGLEFSLDELSKGEKLLISHQDERYFCQWFTGVRDIAAENLVLPPDEVIAAKWFSPEELRTAFLAAPESFTRAAPIYLPLFLG